jgi:hypothetical protein
MFLDPVAFSPDGKSLAAESGDQLVRVWAVNTGKERISFKGTAVAFSPDGRRLASIGKGDVKLLDARTGREILTLETHPKSAIWGVAFSPDGQRLASGGQDFTVAVWDTNTGQQLLTLKGHTNMVFAVAFSPDGRRLASASNDSTVKIWDVLTGQETLTLRGHTNFVSGVAFSPDGQKLASASWDGTVKVWETAALTEEQVRRRRAVVIAHQLFESLDTQAEVMAHLRQDRFLGEPLRSEVMELVKQHQVDPVQLNNRSWAAVRQPDTPPNRRERALRQAREASRLGPENGGFLNTLGVALYRCGQYQAALDALTRSEQLNTAQGGTADPADLAFMAMAQHRLGKKEAARQTLASLRQAANSPRYASDEESQAFLREAEKLLQGAVAVPAK